MKRANYLSWPQYFMGIAVLSSQRSKDPSSQVGTCIVNQENKIVGIGYNGFPIGIEDDELPWEREGEWLETKYPYVVHAETNAITNAISNLKGSILFTTLFPCNECTKLIIQHGISKVIYLTDKYANKDFVIASKKMLDLAKIPYEQFNNTSTNNNLKFMQFLLE